MAAPLALLALLVELVAGYPDALMKAIGHPVTWMGRLI
ncbi:MAG TPA: cobalamin biosynthesis protein, partial [Methyloceanibacter sp.]|nr:cobalamin biosynthesis protein [Methyloceanibacter sp.]HUU66666.1 cobalamin biosynthesis protein [Methyloceanibacter sp.]